MNDSSEHTLFRSGFVGIVGKANAGKSTLLNHFVGMKLAIVSDKPQTTRYRMLGILSSDSAQVIFVDTPGILQPRDKLNEALIDQARRAIEDLDICLHIVDATDNKPMTAEMTELLKGVRAPKVLVVNKIDLLKGGFNPAKISPSLALDNYCNSIGISALKGEGCTSLLQIIEESLPEGPRYFDDDDLTDRDMRFIASEIVREKVFLVLGDEIPYATATQCEEYREQEGEKIYIRIVLYVERDSQKQIVIGKDGSIIRRIGAEARRDIEAILEEPVYLDLWVKVRKNWRKKEIELKRFGLKR